MERVEVAVVGAGPFGLSVAAHLAPHRHVRTFGEPMHTWRALMPPDMLMRSHWDETKLSCPGDRGTLQHWAAETGVGRREPLPLEMFLRYSDWFRSSFVPESDPANVSQIERTNGSFAITTAAGDSVEAKRLVLAVGVMPFPRVPAPLAGIDDPRIAYGVEPTVFDGLRGKRVVVLGGGQNGLESAALALRAGAESVEIVVRSDVRWFTPREHWVPRSRLRRRLYRLAYPVIGFGPPPINRFVLRPELFAKLPLRAREYLNTRLLRPGGSPWIRGEIEGRVAITSQRTLVRAKALPAGIQLTLDDGTTREADQLVVCVGYRFDLGRLTWLAAPVRERIACDEGWPVLDRAFRTTDPAIQFVGYAAQRRFGPLSRFVAGTTFTAERAASLHLG
jgi:cation diffusion facilitator CzcD-associated flavoprotein CzcO